MSDYSGYQRKRAHALGPFASVHEAAAPDGRPGRFALKIFHPPASRNIRRAYAIEGWLLAAERQQKSAKPGGAVLEVLAFGRCPEGAYMVIPWQEHSLEPLVQTLAAKGDLLRAVAECLFDALEQWGVQTGGSHRKLKPANVFLTRSGPLQGMKAVLSDPWFQLGGKSDAVRVNDLAAVGAILAQIVRRREVAAWPIEDAPEWKALGRPGKAWLAYVNFLLDPKPASGELTIAEARRRLRLVPKDARPVRNAILIGTAAVLVVAGGIAGFARFGDPIYMPLQVQKLAVALRNPKAYRETVTEKWPLLCRAWESWLLDLQNSAKRLDRSTDLWAPNDPLKAAIANFVASAEQLRPERLVPEAAGKGLGLLASSPPEDVRNELRKITVYPAVDAAYDRISFLAGQLEKWQRWEELRTLLTLLEERGFTRAAGALRPRLPAVPGGAGYKLDTAVVQTLKLFNEVSLDTAGTLPLASRWSELTKLRGEMEGTTDRVQQAMPRLILARLEDRSSLADFADSLVDPLEEMRRRRQQFLDPAVVRERFLKESVLQTETAEVTVADFPRWAQELALYSKVPAADDPRLGAALDAGVTRLPANAAALEDDAPAAEPGGPATLSAADFRTEFQARTAELTKLRAREIVRFDLPAVSEETNQLAARFQLLEQRLTTTLALLNAEIWLRNIARAYGNFNETRQRWAAWQATLAGVTPAELNRDRPRFRGLRAQERQVKEWINGLEGPAGLGALIVPDLAALSADTTESLRQLEAARREQAAAAAAGAAEWQAALPVAPWANASAAVRAPLDGHRQWLGELPAFGADLDRLNGLLAGGFGWDEGVGGVLGRLDQRPGLAALTGRPAEWNAEARLLGQLVNSTDRAALTVAAQSGGLSRKLTAWRRLGSLTGWPAGPEDLDVDGAVVAMLRAIARDVQDESRRTSLLDELTRETRVRWNRAARNSAGEVAKLSAVFERMDRYGITEGDLEAPAAYNLRLWRLKRADWSEVDLAPLRQRRDEFVAAVRAIPGLAAPPAVEGFLRQLADIELIVDPNRAPTPSPRLAGWQEELTDAGLGLTATWQRGGKTVKLDFAIVQPPDDTPPFYLARRAVAVGEFLDLLTTRSKEEAGAVLGKMPVWAVGESYNKPYNKPMAWRPFITSSGKYEGLELNPSWFFYKTAPVAGLLDDDSEARAKTPALNQVAAEKPTLRSPLQQVPPDAAKLFAEKILGARLPTLQEWQAVMKVVGKPAAGNFRGPNFQSLFNYLRDYNVAGQTIPWRPNEGVFLPRVATPDGLRRNYVDEGQASADPDESRFWFAPVDEGPATGGFINLTGNVSIFLEDPATRQFYVAGGSALSPPGIDFTQPQKVEAASLIGAKPGTEAYSDVGIRPAFAAPPGFRERYNLLVLVREQGFLTW